MDDRMWEECEDRGRCDIRYLPTAGGDWWCFGCEQAATVLTVVAEDDGAAA